MQLSLSISLPDEEPSLESDGFFLLSLSAILHVWLLTSRLHLGLQCLCRILLRYSGTFLLFFYLRKSFQLSHQECADIAKTLKSKDFTLFHVNNIRAEGETFQFLREIDEKTVLGKRKGLGAITLQSTKTAVIIAHCPENGQHGHTTKAVGVIADYLESMAM